LKLLDFQVERSCGGPTYNYQEPELPSSDFRVAALPPQPEPAAAAIARLAVPYIHSLTYSLFYIYIYIK
jgi:hypothetical protein